MKVKSESEVAQLCPTLSDHMDCRLPGFSAHGIFQARVLEWVAIAFSSKPIRPLKKPNSPQYDIQDRINAFLMRDILFRGLDSIVSRLF